MGRTHTRIRVLCEAEALWATGLAIIDEAKVEDFAGTAEDVDNLLLGETLKASVNVKCGSYEVHTIWNVANEDGLRRRLGRECRHIAGFYTTAT